MKKAYLYVLRSEKNFQLYVGVTNSIEKRLARHNAGQVPSTSKNAPYKIVYSEEFCDLTSARRREKFLKTTQGKRVIQNKLLSLARHKEGGLPKSDNFRVGAALCAAQT